MSAIESWAEPAARAGGKTRPTQPNDPEWFGPKRLRRLLSADE
jgi:hypothetical protein